MPSCLYGPEDFDLLVLPGGDRCGDQWERGENLEIFPLVQAVFAAAVVAVGSAVLSLADLGLLDTIPIRGPIGSISAGIVLNTAAILPSASSLV